MIVEPLARWTGNHGQGCPSHCKDPEVSFPKIRLAAGGGAKLKLQIARWRIRGHCERSASYRSESFFLEWGQSRLGAGLTSNSDVALVSRPKPSFEPFARRGQRLGEQRSSHRLFIFSRIFSKVFPKLSEETQCEEDTLRSNSRRVSPVFAPQRKGYLGSKGSGRKAETLGPAAEWKQCRKHWTFPLESDSKSWGSIEKGAQPMVDPEWLGGKKDNRL